MSEVQQVDQAPDPAWQWAEQVAATHRRTRLETVRRHRRDRVFGPLVAVLWLAALVMVVIGLAEGEDGYGWSLAGLGALFAYAGVGGWWLATTGRYLFRGSRRSIRAALPPEVQRSVRRQLALKEPLDPQHADVVVELAYQGRELVIGQVAFLALYVPFYINIAHSLHGMVLGAACLTFGAVMLVLGAIFSYITWRRLSHLISRTPKTTTT